MKIKEFFSITKKKLLITIILFLLLIFIIFGTCATCTGNVASLWERIAMQILLWPTLIISKIFEAIIGRSTGPSDIIFGILAIIFNGFYYYTIGCVIDMIIKKK
jgi:hypothetical protein